MFLAVGSGAYVAAIFHMITHAFFKALLFLGSGSVIHGMHHEQDMRKMGALRLLMPVTAMTFIIGWLAIAGVPPFAGFWSKDEILLFAFAKSPILYVVGMVTALLTAYYMTRQVIMVFFGEARWKDRSEENGAHGDNEPHESPATMLFPLIVLAGLSIVGGVIQLPFTKDLHFLEKWLHPVVEFGEADIHTSWAYENKYLLLVIAAAVALAGIATSFLVYSKNRIRAVEPEILARGWYYDKAITNFMGGRGRDAFDAVATVDNRVVDGAVNGVATLVQRAAGSMRRTQTGAVRTYAAGVGVGVLALLIWFFLRGVVL
jgi:NADH-quinone oxidoreductase subunit L